MTRIALVGRLLVLGVGMALATIALGWWAVAATGVAFAIIDGRRRSALDAGLGAGLGWAMLLGVAAVRGDVLGVARSVGGAVGLPPAALLVIAVAFPTALAWSSAA